MDGVKKVWFDQGRVFIETAAGQVKSQPMRFFPRLQQASEQQRAQWSQSRFGLHWGAIDEDISFESFNWPDNDPQALHSVN